MLLSLAYFVLRSLLRAVAPSDRRTWNGKPSCPPTSAEGPLEGPSAAGVLHPGPDAARRGEPDPAQATAEGVRRDPSDASPLAPGASVASRRQVDGMDAVWCLPWDSPNCWLVPRLPSEIPRQCASVAATGREHIRFCSRCLASLLPRKAESAATMTPYPTNRSAKSACAHARAGLAIRAKSSPPDRQDVRQGEGGGPPHKEEPFHLVMAEQIRHSRIQQQQHPESEALHQQAPRQEGAEEGESEPEGDRAQEDDLQDDPRPSPGELGERVAVEPRDDPATRFFPGRRWQRWPR